MFRRFYASIEDPSAEPEYPQFADGLRQLIILEAELESNRRMWFDRRDEAWRPRTIRLACSW